MTEGTTYTDDIRIVFPTYDISVMQENDNLLFLLKKIIIRYKCDVPVTVTIYYRVRQGQKKVYTKQFVLGDKKGEFNLPLFMTATEYHYEVSCSSPRIFELIEIDVKHFLIPKGLR